MTKYTIISIGPIYETMKIADNTRALWTASYIFSYLMQETIINMHQYKNDFIVPTANAEFIKSGNRAGLFHDRCILQGDCSEALNNAYNKALETLSEIMIGAFEISQKYKHVSVTYDKNEVKDFVKGYFQSYITAVELTEDDNPVLELSKYVDAVEYEPKLAPYEEKEYLFLFFRIANLALTKKFAFLNDANKTDKNRCFKSLPEIAASELVKEWSRKSEYFCQTIDDLNARSEAEKNAESLDEEIFVALSGDKETKDKLKPYHKYVAIVQADGDAFGAYLESLKGDIKKLHMFSDNIFTFSDQARKIVEDNGGAVVMAGGDDLLFFAPVVDGSSNIFTLIDEIDKKFTKIFSDKTLSMSYGVSITYYKFPLQEALSLASDALWSHAKQTKWSNRKERTSEKNAIHLNVQKHSGQSHSLSLPKDTKLYEKFVSLFSKELSSDETFQLPHSLHHALESAEEIISLIGANKVEHFFKNQFDEEVHTEKYGSALEAVKQIIIHLKSDDEPQHLLDDKDKCKYSEIEILFSMLSTIKLLRGDA